MSYTLINLVKEKGICKMIDEMKQQMELVDNIRRKYLLKGEIKNHYIKCIETLKNQNLSLFVLNFIEDTFDKVEDKYDDIINKNFKNVCWYNNCDKLDNIKIKYSKTRLSIYKDYRNLYYFGIRSKDKFIYNKLPDRIKTILKIDNKCIRSLRYNYKKLMKYQKIIEAKKEEYIRNQIKQNKKRCLSQFTKNIKYIGKLFSIANNDINEFSNIFDESECIGDFRLNYNNKHFVITQITKSKYQDFIINDRIYETKINKVDFEDIVIESISKTKTYRTTTNGDKMVQGYQIGDNVFFNQDFSY